MSVLTVIKFKLKCVATNIVCVSGAIHYVCIYNVILSFS